MKYHIEKQGREIVIRFEQLDGQAEAVIEAIGRCRKSAWACPSGECTRIALMETCVDGDGLAVSLKPQPDGDLSIASIGECLKYQLPKETRV